MAKLDPKHLIPLEQRRDHIVDAIEKELKDIRGADGRILPGYQYHVLKMVCQLTAFGVSPQRIANNIGIPSRNVKLLMRSVSMQREVARLQTEIWKDNKKAFNELLPEAINTTAKLMRSKTTKDSTRIEAAKVIMDRSLGKPTQYIEQSTSLIKEVLLKLNKEDISDAQLVENDFDKELLENNEKVQEAVRKADSEVDPLEEILMGDCKLPVDPS